MTHQNFCLELKVDIFELHHPVQSIIVLCDMLLLIFCPLIVPYNVTVEKRRTYFYDALTGTGFLLVIHHI